MEGSTTVLVEAKEEYTKQLITIIKSCIYQGIKSIYADAKDICNQDNTPEKVLMVFQDLLSRIPKWSQTIIDKEYNRIKEVSNCDYIEDLLKVIYVSHIKVLTIIHNAQKNKKITIKVPNGGHFIHLCYIECAREFWKDPYLLSDNLNKYELQKNMRESETMIAECIAETIRKQLPVRHILKEFLNEPDEDIDEAEDDIKDPVNKKYMKKLETVVKKELKTTEKSSNTGEIDIELIRKVIREELDSRPNDTASSGTIKKELVNTVIEKIVEKSLEKAEDSPLNGGALGTEVSDVSEVSEVKEDFTPNIEIPEPTTISDDASKKDKDNTNENKDTVEPTKKDKDIEDKDNTNENKDTVEPVKKDKKDKDNEDKDTVEQAKATVEPAKVETTDIDNENTSNSTNINDLIEELDGGNMKTVDDDIVINTDAEPVIATEKNKEDNEKQNVISQPVKQHKEITINNIDEINLNLDELDYDIENQSDMELEEVDIKASSASSAKNNSNEVKKDNTKYIFFNDAE